MTGKEFERLKGGFTGGNSTLSEQIENALGFMEVVAKTPDSATAEAMRDADRWLAGGFAGEDEGQIGDEILQDLIDKGNEYLPDDCTHAFGFHPDLPGELGLWPNELWEEV